MININLVLHTHLLFVSSQFERCYSNAELLPKTSSLNPKFLHNTPNMKKEANLTKQWTFQPCIKSSLEPIDYLNLVLQVQHFMLAVANQKWSFIDESFCINCIIILHI